MKGILLKSFKWFIDWMSYVYDRFSKENSELSPYHPLSPTDEAKNIDHYVDSLDWALRQGKRIKNIAISGPFGSGKSSFIETFQKISTNRNYHFLNISLATFEESKESKEPKASKTSKESSNKPEDETLRLIELSILQQLFYFEEDKNIPDSRFKKIRNHRFRRLVFLSSAISLFLVALTYLISPSFLTDILRITAIPTQVEEWIHYLTLLLSALGAFYIILRSTRFLQGFVISKLSFKNAEIEIDTQISKSILNKHIDEILYFFEVTPYNIVVIEDLDRFEQTEVFTKLREINLLINNSKKVKQNVTFIYAVRDDMFQGYDRTKFFDFTIPIIPVINSSNSIEQLSKIVKNNAYDISAELLDNISLFIDDMRLLNNIMNEYHLYSKSLDENLSQDKLLAMMVYKNIIPKDFAKLNNNQGILYGVISAKHRYVRERIRETDDEITKIKIAIEQLERTRLKDIGELRTIYLAKCIIEINMSSPSFSTFNRNGQRIRLDQAIEDTNFEYFKTANRVQYFDHQRRRTYANFSFADIEHEVDAEQTYLEREQLIIDKNENKLGSLQTQLEYAEEKKKKTRESKLKELLSQKEIDIEVVNGKHKDLLSILLRFGYIAEDYFDYISIFYEGSLSRADYQFLISIRTQQFTEFGYELSNIENLFKRINPAEFDNKFVLNYSLVEFLLSNNQHDEKRKRLFAQLSNQSESSTKFIDGFVDYTANIDLFIQLLCRFWPQIWRFLEHEAGYTEEKVARYFKLIIEHADVSDIKKIFSDYRNRIAKNRDFLRIIDDREKIGRIIGALDIKFVDIDPTSPSQLIKVILDGNYYVINPEMLTALLTHHQAFNQVDFDSKNYSHIKSSDLQPLNDHIEANINEYVHAVYLKLENNVAEPLETLIELLNNSEISLENREGIVVQTETIIEDIDSIDDLQVVHLLLKESKILVNWENTLSIYVRSENKLSDELISFFNIVDNAQQLSDRKIQDEGSKKEIKSELIQSLLLDERVNDESYANIVKAIPYTYEGIDFSALSYQKVELLVKHKRLITNSHNFEILRGDFEKLHISLIENDPENLIDDIEPYNLEKNDVLELLKSTQIPTSVKEKLIACFEKTYFTDNRNLLTQIGHLILNDGNFDFDDRIIIKSVLTQSSLSSSAKIKVFNEKSRILSNNNIDEFLRSMDEPYSEIAENGKRPKLRKTPENKSFVEILKQKEYISSYRDSQNMIGSYIRIETFRTNQLD